MPAPLQKQVIPIQLGYGIDQKTDPIQIAPGKLITAQNTRYSKTGRLEPRLCMAYGNATISGNPRLDRVFAFGAQSLFFTAPNALGSAERLRIYDPNLGALVGNTNILRDVCDVPTVPRALVRNVDTVTQPTFADTAIDSTGRYQCIATIGALTGGFGTVTVTIIDLSNGRNLVTGLQVGGTNQTKHVRVLPKPGAGTFVVVLDSGGTSFYELDPTANPVVATSRGNVSDFGLLDAVVTTNGGIPLLFILDTKSAGGFLTRVNMNTWAQTFVGLNTFLTATATVGILATPEATTSVITAVFVDGSAAKFWYMQFDPNTLATVTAKTTISNATPIPVAVSAIENSADAAFPLKIAAQKYTGGSTANDFYSVDHWEISSGGAPTLVCTSRSLALATKLVRVDANRIFFWGQWFHNTASDAWPQNAYFLWQFGVTSSPRAMLAQGLCSAWMFQSNNGGAQATLGDLPSIVQQGNTFRAPAILDVGLADSGSHTTIQTTLVFSIDTTQGWRSVQRDGNTLLLSGGYLTQYDGKQITETGALLYPDAIGLGQTIVGGGKVNGGTYSVLAVYVRMDAAGRLNRGPVGIAGSFTLAGFQTLDVTVPTLRVGNDLTSVKIQLYSTINGGQTYYLEQTLSNDPTVDTLSAHLNASDTALQALTPLYTSGGVSEDMQLSAPLTLAMSPTRLLVVSGDAPTAMQPSKEMLSGIGLGFYQDALEPIHQGDIEIKGIAYVAGRTFAFKDRAIFATTGDGPDLTGNNDTIGIFEMFSQDVGLSDAASLITTTFGVVFKSHKGFYLLGRDGGLTYIGADVEDTAAANTIVDAAFCEDTREVRFLFSGGAGALVLTMFETKDGAIDWKWCTDQYNFPINALASVNGTFAIAIRGSTIIALLTAPPHNGDLGTTLAGTHTTPSNVTQVIYETGWLNLFGLQGFGRIWRAFILGDVLAGYDSRETIWIDVAYDGVDGGITTGEFYTETLANAIDSGTRLQVMVRPANQKCQSIKFRIYSRPGAPPTQSSALGTSFSVSGLLLELGMKGRPRLAPAKVV